MGPVYIFGMAHYIKYIKKNGVMFIDEWGASGRLELLSGVAVAPPVPPLATPLMWSRPSGSTGPPQRYPSSQTGQGTMEREPSC